MTTVNSPSTLRIETDGPCFRATLDTLLNGGASRPLTPDALHKAKHQAIEVLGEVIASYQKDIALGEVGARGSARASPAPPSAGNCPTGLLYGRVQSGKTNAMIVTSALALDNGFRIIVVLTSDNRKLVSQTARRFQDIQGPISFDSTQMDQWHREVKHVRKQLAQTGIVLISSKNGTRLNNFIDFLTNIDAFSYPALIFDDEGDQATPDTTIAARAAKKPKAPLHSSTINRKTIKNNAREEEGRSIREKLGHNIYLLVTATPYALLLQNLDSALRPQFTKLLEPGDGYTGGDAFFAQQFIEGDGSPPLVFVDEEESAEIAKGEESTPRGLIRALSFFVVSASTQFLIDPTAARKEQNFLCHTSPKTIEHARLESLIRDFIDRVLDELRSPGTQKEVALYLREAHAELRRTVPSLPDLNAIRECLKGRLPRRVVVSVNAANGEVELKLGLNFIVGGNILGRGVTIDNLLVTYYLRRAKITQMDTMLQHARMFGYRRDIMPLTRVYLPQDLAVRFFRIQQAENALRERLEQHASARYISIPTVPGLRPTRPNVLDANNLGAFGGGDHVYPSPLVRPSNSKENALIERALVQACGGPLRPNECIDVSTESLITLLDLLPYGLDVNWDVAGLRTVLQETQSQFGGRGTLYYRAMARTNHMFETGALEGRKELQKLRSAGLPVLALFRDSGKQMKRALFQTEFWYPSMIFPESMATHVFNVVEAP
jgi:Z1 domain-containing protein